MLSLKHATTIHIRVNITSIMPGKDDYFYDLYSLAMKDGLNGLYPPAEDDGSNVGERTDAQSTDIESDGPTYE